jgi:hypothetical protein
VLVHGDIHEWNALASKSGYKLIDPDGLFAEPEYDLGVIMRQDSVHKAQASARWLADRTGRDAAAILDWATIERLATALHCTRLDLQSPPAAPCYRPPSWLRKPGSRRGFAVAPVGVGCGDRRELKGDDVAGGGEGVGVAGVGGAQGRAHLVVGLHRLDGQARHADGEFADGLGTRGDKGVFGDEQGMRPSFMLVSHCWHSS